MKTGILHIGDFHFLTDEFDLIDDFDISIVIDNYDLIEKIIIVISGDIAKGGSYKEYECAEKFLNILISNIRRKIKDIEVLVVPGNHDICLSLEEEREATIRKHYDEGMKIEIIENELDKQKNFFKFVNKYNCFNDRKLVDVKTINMGDNKVKFVLINSAPFSTLSSKTHSDKGLHYCKNNEINQINHGGVDYIFTIMHHSFEWFEDESREQLEDLIRNRTELVFTGHEHSDKVFKEIVDDKTTFISRCGEISISRCEGCLNFLVFDDTDAKMIFDKYEIQKGMNIKNIKTQSYIINSKNPINYDKKFLKEFCRNDTLHIDNFNDSFVFPKTICSKDKTIINNIDEFNNKFKDDEIVVIKGSDRVGKTTFIRHLYTSLMLKKHALYIDIEEIKSKKAVEKILKDAYKNQYNEDATDKLMYEDRSERVLFIDNIDKINKDIDKNEFLESLKNKFSVIYATSSKREWENIKEQYKETLLSNIEECTIEPFALEKRNELVRKICVLFNCESDEEIAQISRKIEVICNNRAFMFNETTDFLVRYIKRVIEDKTYQSDNYYNAYSALFENDIIDSLRQNVDKKYIEDYMNIYQLIAYNSHTQKQSTINIKEISDIIDQYNNDFHKQIDTNRFINVSVQIKLFVDYCNNYSFKSKTYLAFFIAKKIYEFINNNEFKDFYYCLENICFGINDDIVIFILYFSKNTKLTNLIYEETLKYFGDWDKLDLENMNLKYLTNSKQNIRELEISTDDKKEYDHIKDKYEQQRINDLEISCNDIYDYNEKDIDAFENKANKAIKLASITSKIIAMSHNWIKYEERKQMLLNLVDFTSKVAYFMFSVFDEDFETFVDELVHSDLLDNIKDEDKRKEVFIDMFVMFTTDVISVLFITFAKQISDDNSRVLIESLNGNLNNHMFGLSALSNIKNTDRLLKYINDNLITNNYTIKNMIVNIFKYYSNNNALSRTDVDKINSFMTERMKISVESFKRKALLTSNR